MRIKCDSNGIEVEGPYVFGSTSETEAYSLQDFLRIAEDWWRTYVELYGKEGEVEHHHPIVRIRSIPPWKW